MSDLNKLYKETILEHNRNPRNYGKPETWTHEAEGLNAVCGDLVHVYLTIEAGLLKQINYAGESCAISMASASMMTEFSQGMTVSQWQHHFDLFKQLMDKSGQVDSFPELGPVNTLATVKKFPSRIKSATLCWYALAAAINGEATATTE
ncbi:Fe-S cluster assembly sulfur transfer protein SufU [Marinicella litoralis]|uniref:Nitrogen fixation NifU-like protein n=1 Tax=Marinicella litoralis TaxID=644220 RepID=A0A4R6XVY2_9GAMM|nr:SUF system NifU family Fe-S cluster assembly protein [Marinicella litoralis]TDR22384.1 nitrogen fixation NifU-like protein [Marinicella litoralis]